MKKVFEYLATAAAEVLDGTSFVPPTPAELEAGFSIILQPQAWQQIATRAVELAIADKLVEGIAEQLREHATLAQLSTKERPSGFTARLDEARLAAMRPFTETVNKARTDEGLPALTLDELCALSPNEKKHAAPLYTIFRGQHTATIIENATGKRIEAEHDADAERRSFTGGQPAALLVSLEQLRTEGRAETTLRFASGPKFDPTGGQRHRYAVLEFELLGDQRGIPGDLLAVTAQALGVGLDMVGLSYNKAFAESGKVSLGDPFEVRYNNKSLTAK